MGELRAKYERSTSAKWEIKKAGNGQTYVVFEDITDGTSIASYFSTSPELSEALVTQVRVIGPTERFFTEFSSKCDKAYRKLDTGLWAGGDNAFLVTVHSRGPVAVMTFTLLTKE